MENEVHDRANEFFPRPMPTVIYIWSITRPSENKGNPEPLQKILLISPWGYGHNFAQYLTRKGKKEKIENLLIYCILTYWMNNANII